ncbi:MAG TPA: choice-of-anchor D domain-containing protein [Acidimicrobiales bacterium]|nr:choice-of-anchor D domain-containing protein [Acidimicrobiales bacterium]
MPPTAVQPKIPGRAQSPGRVLALGLLVALVSVMLAGVMPRAKAAVVALPPAPPTAAKLSVFPVTDIIIVNDAPGAALTVVVTRNGVQIGTVSGTADATGAFNVNHPPAVCFTGSTPDLLPGDVVTVTSSANGTYGTQVANVTSAAATQLDASTVQVTGTAFDPAGTPMNLALVQERLVSKKVFFARNGRRDLRAPLDGTLAADPTVPGGWVATFSGLTAADVTTALASLNQASWLGRNPVLANEVSTYEFGLFGGPAPGCPPQASYGVTTATPAKINAATTGDVALSGLSSDASSVALTVTDGNGRSVVLPAVTPVPAAGPQTWTATLLAATIAASFPLASPTGAVLDGPLTVTGAYTTAGGVLTGSTLTIPMDRMVPLPPTATPAPGTFSQPQNVSLSAEPGATIHYTTDGVTVPSAASPTYAGPISVPVTTTIQANATDAAGNVSPAATFAFTVNPGLQLATTSLSFGTAPVGSATSTESVSVKNVGLGSIAITGATVTGDSTSFSTPSGTCVGAALAVGSSCTFDVAFMPAATGARAATMTINSSAIASTPFAVALDGVGIPVLRTATPSVSSINFGAKRVGTPSDWQVVTITNTGNSPMTVNSMSLAGASPSNFDLQGTTCGTVPSGGSCSATVRFHPHHRGDWSATLDVLSDAPDAHVVLQGKGAPPGYFLVAEDGGIFALGDAAFHGSAAPLTRTPVHAMATTPSGQGYWEVSEDGTVFAFGDANPAFHLAPGFKLNQPIVGMSATINGDGLWLVAEDGGVFALGNAPYYGSMGGIPLNAPIIGMSTAPGDKGYYLLASDGGIFSFGAGGNKPPFLGSTGGFNIPAPIVAMEVSQDGTGYWLAGQDGSVYAFGAKSYGSLRSLGIRPNKPIVGMASTAGGGGYWLIASDGGVFSFGDAIFNGSTGSVPLVRPITAAAAIR